MGGPGSGDASISSWHPPSKANCSGLGAQFRLQSLGGLKYMGTNSLALQTGIDRQHIVQQVRDRGKGQMRRPFGLQELELGSRMGRQQRFQRAKARGDGWIRSLSRGV